MNDKKLKLELTDPVPFDDPDSFEAVADLLEFLPEAVRRDVLKGFVGMVTFF